jgi:hypothetical protein
MIYSVPSKGTSVKTFYFIIASLFCFPAVAQFNQLKFDAVSKEQVESVLSNLKKIYEVEINNLGVPFKTKYDHDKYTPEFGLSAAEITVKEEWNDSINGFSSYYLLRLTGVYTRIDGNNTDAVALLICHELGHILGGAPIYDQNYTQLASPAGFNHPMAVEGQSDYFASAKCFKRYAQNTPLDFVLSADSIISEKCSRAYIDIAEQELCKRTAMAGKVLANNLRRVKIYSGYNEPWISFDHPATYVSDFTQTGHPEYQCRLDTYLAGALCKTPTSGPSNWKDAENDFCKFNSLGGRPSCWYSPFVYDHL